MVTILNFLRWNDGIVDAIPTMHGNNNSAQDISKHMKQQKRHAGVSIIIPTTFSCHIQAWF